tara:strand:- start:18 stop:755 length:738 start_codon:yes stop_codon:yes gene_type:complete
MNYKQKYLKYKLKYLNLKKKMSGGSLLISEKDKNFLIQQKALVEKLNEYDDNKLATILTNRTHGNIEDIESELAKFRKSISQLVELGGITVKFANDFGRKITSVEKILIVDPIKEYSIKKEKEAEEKQDEYIKQKKEFEKKYGINFEEAIISAPIHAATTIQSMLKGKQGRREAEETKHNAAATIQSMLKGKQGRKEAAEENKRYTEGFSPTSFGKLQKAKYNKKKPYKSDNSDNSDNSDGNWSD